MASSSEKSKRKSILVINPNSTKEMTKGLEKLISHADLKDGQHKLAFTYFTAPSGPSSINNEEDAKESMEHCTPELTEEKLEDHDGFVVACYSQHPLVEWLEERTHVKKKGKAVMGIMQASVVRSLGVIGHGKRFGVVTTTKEWQPLLQAAIERMKNVGDSLAGVESTGYSAKELHNEPAAKVEKAMIAATKRLLRKGSVEAVCLGCAGMAGMEEVVRRGCSEELGKDEGSKVHIVDGVLAAVELIRDRIAAETSREG